MHSLINIAYIMLKTQLLHILIIEKKLYSSQQHIVPQKLSIIGKLVSEPSLQINSRHVCIHFVGKSANLLMRVIYKT